MHLTSSAATSRGPSGRGVLRVLTSADAAALTVLCERDPIANLFVSSRALDLLYAPHSSPGCQLWGWFEDGRLVSACWSGANLVPVEATPAALDAFAERARAEGRRCSSFVGPAEAVLALWQRLEPHWRGARDVRACQPLMVCDSDPAIPSDPAVRRGTWKELDIVVPACVAMFTEEIGYPPAPPGRGGAYGERVAQIVSSGRSFVRVDDGAEGPEVVFKAELGEVSSGSLQVQVQGVWVAPHRRGEGLAAPGMAAVVRTLRSEGVRSVSLYVNDYNTRALAAYRRVGFRQVGTYATVLF